MVHSDEAAAAIPRDEDAIKFAAETDRVNALIAYDVLDTCAEACFDRMSQAAADLCGTPMALISLVDHHRQWFKANIGVPATETGRGIAFCAHAILGDGVFIVEDATLDERFAHNPLVTGSLGLRFYAGAPLVTPGGHRVGTLCVLDTIPRPLGLGGREQSVLQTLAAQVVTELELRRSVRLSELQRVALERSGAEVVELQKLVADALEGSGIQVWEWDAASGEVKTVDRIYAEAAGAAAPGLAGSIPPRWIDDVHPDDLAILRDRSSDYFNGRSTSLECEIRVGSDDREWRWQLVRGSSRERGANGRAVKVSGTLTDIDLRRRAEDRLHWAVHHDSLTGLANRLLFNERLEAALQSANSQAPDVVVGVALLDLDLFKQVNDIFGHAVGDALLQEVATRLQKFQGPGETCARLGGDEFTIILAGAGCDEIESRLDGLLDSLREPFEYKGSTFDCRASVGFTCYPAHGKDAETLLKNADLAMFQAKALGRGMVFGYKPQLAFEVQRRVATLEAVRTALRADVIVPYYQAQVDSSFGKVEGFEALLRIKGADGTVYLPESIEEAFDDVDLAVAIGRCMLRQVIADMARWIEAGVPFGHVAVNASAAELRRGDYVPSLLELLKRAGVPASRLHVEVVETVFLGRGAGRVDETLQQLSQAGVKIALDDFGTGFASLTHLKKFPIDIVKIDRSFVRELEYGGDDVAIVGAVISLADKLGIEVIAEGVETASQALLLRANGCSVLQGFHFHRPCPAEEVPATSLSTLGSAPLCTVSSH